MQRFRKCVLVVSLSTGIALGAAAGPPPNTHSARSLDDSVITRVLAFFGIELRSRISTPPG